MHKYLIIVFFLGSFSIQGQVNVNNSIENYTTRELIKIPNTTVIKSDENCKITLKLKVDHNGSIASKPEIILSETTTTNQQLINSVIELIIAETAYTSKPGSDIELVKLTIRIKAY